MSFDSYEKWCQNRLETAERVVRLADQKLARLQEELACAEMEAATAQQALVTEQTFLSGPDAKKQFFGGAKKRHELAESLHAGMAFYKFACAEN